MSTARSPASARLWDIGGPARTASARGGQRTRGTTTRTDVAIELHPLEQFTIEPLIPIHIGRLDLTYTNSALMMTIAAVLVTTPNRLADPRGPLVPRRWQPIAEVTSAVVADI